MAEGILREPSAGTYHHFYLMVVPVVDEWNRKFGLLDAVDRHALNFGTTAAIVYRDVIKGLAIAIVDLERRPIRGKAGREAEFVDLQDASPGAIR